MNAERQQASESQEPSVEAKVANYAREHLSNVEEDLRESIVTSVIKVLKTPPHELTALAQDTDWDALYTKYGTYLVTHAGSTPNGIQGGPLTESEYYKTTRLGINASLPDLQQIIAIRIGLMDAATRLNYQAGKEKETSFNNSLKLVGSSIGQAMKTIR